MRNGEKTWTTRNGNDKSWTVWLKKMPKPICDLYEREKDVIIYIKKKIEKEVCI